MASRRYSTTSPRSCASPAMRARQLAQPLAAGAGVRLSLSFSFSWRSCVGVPDSEISSAPRSRGAPCAAARASPRLVVVAGEVQRAVHHHVRPVRLERLAVAQRFAPHDVARRSRGRRAADGVARHAARWTGSGAGNDSTLVGLSLPRQRGSARGSRAAPRRAPRSRGPRRGGPAPPRPSDSCASAPAPRRACRGRGPA